ncbi:hypothetical protein K461DRAFT_123042 [Myriangium duriaei CBS 260.36]|uniref:Secreted protein n=1 Tax=Myriangium duriaei CBS 260.36 TaxID=1168546 RepID=A0A9P4J4U4_9PEZI|nr:hypothetical protein K461DRAFT_123042 [Myriangium duriaei CBS 260.36]
MHSFARCLLYYHFYLCSFTPSCAVSIKNIYQGSAVGPCPRNLERTPCYLHGEREPLLCWRTRGACLILRTPSSGAQLVRFLLSTRYCVLAYFVFARS